MGCITRSSGSHCQLTNAQWAGLEPLVTGVIGCYGVRMARQSARGSVVSSSYRASGDAPSSPPVAGCAGAAPSCCDDREAGAATLASGVSGAFTGAPGASAGMGAGAAIRAARLRDASRALDRGDVRSAVGLLLEAVRDEAG